MAIVIDDNLRTMTIPTDLVLLGVESDDDVNKIPFRMPKTYCGYDLSTFEARVNYMNAKGEGDIYIAQDLTVDGDDMTFTWIVGRKACEYKGNTKFIVCLKKFDSNHVCVQEFNTTVYTLPVLEGLETYEAVVQENADIIEQILSMIDDSGMFDPNQYYTKSQVDARIPTKLPNPQKLVIDGTEYDGSVAKTVETNSIRERQLTTGKIANIVDAVPGVVDDLGFYTSEDQRLASAYACITNKNLFRIDLMADTNTTGGIMVKKRSDHSFGVSGTTIADEGGYTIDADISGAFEVGKTYTLSSGKSSGFASVVLVLGYADSTSDTFYSTNTAATFTVSKRVTSVRCGIVVEGEGIAVNEIVYPQLEVGKAATAWVDNYYDGFLYIDGENYPELPDEISNIFSKSNIAKIVVDYKSDTVFKKIDEYIKENVYVRQINGNITATYDGLGTVSIGVG